jgi:acyl carrier protein
MDQILQRINDVLSSIAGNLPLQLTESMEFEKIPGYDSLMHIQFLNALEKKFNLKFSSREIIGFQTIGQVCDIIRKRSSGV